MMILQGTPESTRVDWMGDNMMIPYWSVLLALSLAFTVTERIRPWRRQPLLRQEIGSDLIYLGFNGVLLALLLAPFIGRIAPVMDAIVVPLLGKAHVAGWPLWGQFMLAFFVVDLIQWCIHFLMHRVPQLWTLHRVHHSITEMDWLGSMRLHWLEIVVYKSLQYVPLLLLGFDWRVLFWLAAFSTAMGHFNHSNLKVPMGPLRYFLNHPTMHIWHHDVELHGGYGCNFGINLSLWDWLFGTAYRPKIKEQPEAIGFPGLPKFPRGFLAQQAVPFSLKVAAKARDRS